MAREAPVRERCGPLGERALPGEPAWSPWCVRKMVGPPRRGGRPAREAPVRERCGPLGERALPRGACMEPMVCS